MAGPGLSAPLRRWPAAIRPSALATRWRAIDWARRDIRDAAGLLLLAILLYVAGEFAGLTDRVFEFARDHPALELDDLIFVTLILNGALIIYAFRRNGDLSVEINARRAAEQEAHLLARHDPLTGLPNRRDFGETLDRELRDLGSARTAVLLLDLNGFKAINDVYGHAAGDAALIGFSQRVAPTLPPGATLARLGGDEFGIILPRIGALGEPSDLAARIAVALKAEPLVIEGTPVMLDCGIGIAIAPDNAGRQDELLRRADIALYRAKAGGRSQACAFAPDLDAHLERRIRLERELHDAIQRDIIKPFYQPLVSLDDSRVVGFEALSRWTGDDPVGPLEFIAVAEEIGLIGELSDRLLRRACRDAAGWGSDLTLAFNISPLQLRDRTLGLRILSILRETGLAPQRLELEITESALVDSLDVAREVINQLRNAGVRVALDDFGTGYATLSQLTRLRLDRLKIDRSFVQRLGSDPESLVVLRAIIGLASGFGLETTAEGIQTREQLACLTANGCRFGQGFLFGKAAPAGSIGELLAGEPPPRTLPACRSGAVAA
jgi:diguanylate cyclase (GGDEF)-like protein